MAERAIRDTLAAIPLSAQSYFELGHLYDSKAATVRLPRRSSPRRRRGRSSVRSASTN
jgi:hypothetical protein